MANIDELVQQVDETKKRLAEMEVELQNAQGGDEPPVEDQEQDGEGEEVPDASQEQSFADRVEERLSPAEEVMAEESSPQVDEVVEESSEEADMEKLYSVVYDENFDSSDVQAEGRMRLMQEAMEDPRVEQMAREDPEKFALFMYGRTSAIA